MRSASCCQGTRFEWCSIVVTRISSPRLTLASPQLRATRLMPAVVPEVKMISRACSAPMKCADFFAGLFVLLGAALAERVDAAVDVGVVALVDAAEDVDHLPRPLRAGGVVEKHERLIAVDGLLQDREVVAQRGAAAALRVDCRSAIVVVIQAICINHRGHGVHGEDNTYSKQMMQIGKSN